jgi:mono/diheme cytochrome c family protein
VLHRTLLSSPALASGDQPLTGRNPQTGRALEHWAQFGRVPAAPPLRAGSESRLGDAARSNRGGTSKTDLAAEHWSQLKQNPNRAIAGRAERLGVTSGAISADREEIVKALLPIAKEKGDVARGQEVYPANCATCHVVNGQGGKIGPDLSGIGVRDRTEILLDILDPNRSVEANYRLWNVTTKDGETFSGRLEAGRKVRLRCWIRRPKTCRSAERHGQHGQFAALDHA